jgi:hypothetical protein
VSSSERKRRFASMGRKGAERAAKTRSYPLRKVVNEHAEFEPGVPAYELECGHKLHPPEDLIGRRYPARMRCAECFRASQPTGGGEGR